MNFRDAQTAPTPVSAKKVDTRMRIEIKDIGIPPWPQTLVAIEREMRKDAPDFTLLSKLIASDIALAAWLIKYRQLAIFWL